MIINNGTNNYKYIPFFEKDQYRDKLPKVKLVEKNGIDNFNHFSWRLSEDNLELVPIVCRLAESINLLLKEEHLSLEFLKDQILPAISTKMFNSLVGNLDKIAKQGEQQIKEYHEFIETMVKDFFKSYSNLFISRSNDPIEERLNELISFFEFIDKAAMISKEDHMVMARAVNENSYACFRSSLDLLTNVVLGFKPDFDPKLIEKDFAISDFNLRHKLHHKDRMQKLDQEFRAAHREQGIMVPEKTNTTRLITRMAYVDEHNNTEELITDTPVINPFVILEQLSRLPEKAHHEIGKLSNTDKIVYIQSLLNCLNDNGISTRFINKLPIFEVKLNSLCQFLSKLTFHSLTVNDTNEVYPKSK